MRFSVAPCSVLGLFAVAVLAVGCSSSSDGDADSSQGAIVGSTEDSSRAASIGQLFVQQITEDRHVHTNFCTAAIVSKRVVVTSAMCFGFRSYIWDSPTVEMPAEVRLGPSVALADAVHPLSTVARSKILVPEALRDASREDQVAGSVAVVILEQPVVGAVTLSVGATSGALDHPVSVWGYGCTKSGSGDDGTLRTRSLKWGEWSGWFGTTFACDPSVATGDLGASVLDETGSLVGVTTPSGDVIAIEGEVRGAIEEEVGIDSTR